MDASIGIRLGTQTNSHHKHQLGATSVPFAVRFLPSLTDVAFLMPILFLFVKLNGARKLLGDGDTGWHIRTGQWILSHGQVPRVDMFSFTGSGRPWFAWEWLWDVLFALLHDAWGMGAVVAASLLLICLTSALLFRLIRRKCQSGLVAIATTLLATGGCAIHWLARPHLFTLLFFVITLHLTDRAKVSRPALLAWLVPLTVIWVNLHGGFFVLFLILATYIGDLAFKAVITGDAVERGCHVRALRPWLLTFAGCAAATLINPYGVALHRHMAQYLTDPYNLRYISEFQGMDFHSAVVFYFEPLMVGGILASMWNLRQGRFQESLSTLGWLQMALMAQRNIPLFSIAVAPVVAQSVSDLLAGTASSNLRAGIRNVSSRFLGLSAGVDKTDRIPRLYLASAAVSFCVGVLLLLPQPAHAKFATTYDPADYPQQALSLLLRPESQRIFADDEWGDYLIYKLYPSRKVFVDGRSDFYGDDFGQKYQEVMTVTHGFQKVLDDYAIDTIVLAPRYSLTSALKLSPAWKVVYDDHVAVVFRRRPDPKGETGSVISGGGGGTHTQEGVSQNKVTLGYLNK